MKIQELRNLSKEELLQKEKALKEELFKLNLQRYGARVEKPHMFGLLKRDLARIETILNEPSPSSERKIKKEELGEKKEKVNG
ncbi:MAG TPA: 50S ribosomal protein L29 [Candidatus Omnitrophota bacterium]|nr:50S ribosomal protein L29 [Candidatus Omnitrophota bacterium]